MVYLQNCCEVGVYRTDSEWQWHQLGHVQVCTLLQRDNHTSTPPLCSLQARCPSCRQTNSHMQSTEGNLMIIKMQLKSSRHGTGIRWAICKSAPRSSQITMPVPHHSVFYRPDALPAAQQHQSTEGKHIHVNIFTEGVTYSCVLKKLLVLWKPEVYVN